MRVKPIRRTRQQRRCTYELSLDSLFFAMCDEVAIKAWEGALQ